MHYFCFFFLLASENIFALVRKFCAYLEHCITATGIFVFLASYTRQYVMQTFLIIAAPNGDLVPAEITQQPGGDYQLEYLSKVTGKCKCSTMMVMMMMVVVVVLT